MFNLKIGFVWNASNGSVLSDENANCILKKNRLTMVSFAWSLAMCATTKGIKAKLLLDYNRLSEPQSLLIHIWSAKKIIELVPDINKIFIDLCEEKLQFLRNQL